MFFLKSLIINVLGFFFQNLKKSSQEFLFFFNIFFWKKYQKHKMFKTERKIRRLFMFHLIFNVYFHVVVVVFFFCSSSKLTSIRDKRRKERIRTRRKKGKSRK